MLITGKCKLPIFRPRNPVIKDESFLAMNKQDSEEVIERVWRDLSSTLETDDDFSSLRNESSAHHRESCVSHCCSRASALSALSALSASSSCSSACCAQRTSEQVRAEGHAAGALAKGTSLEQLVEESSVREGEAVLQTLAAVREEQLSH